MAKITGKGIFGIVAGVGVAAAAVISMLVGKEKPTESDPIEVDDYEEVDVEAVEDEAK